MEAPRTVLIGRSRGGGRAAVARLAFALAIGYGQPLFASPATPPTTKSWVGGRVGSWHDPLAWSPLGVPNNGSSGGSGGGSGNHVIVVITGRAGQDVAVALADDVTVSGLALGSGDRLDVAGATALGFENPGLSAVASIDGIVQLAGPESALLVDGILAIDGQGVLVLDHPTARLGAGGPGSFLATFEGLTIAGSGQLGDDQLALHNGGTIRADGPMVIDPGGGIAAFVNFGLLHVAAPRGALTLAPGSAESWGEIRVDRDATLSLSSALMANEGSILIDGAIVEASSATGQTLLIVTRGRLAGSGTIGVGMTLGEVSVEPGESDRTSDSADPIGTLTIEDFAGSPQSHYRFEVRSIANGDHDRLVSTTGGVFDGGTVEVRMIDGCVPAAGDEIELVQVAEFFVNPPKELVSCFAAELVVTANSLGVRFLEGSGVGCDIDLDGVVAAPDLAVLLGAWGSEEPCQRSDLSGDGVVDAVDLSILLGHWSL